jgi:hypothetical protein
MTVTRTGENQYISAGCVALGIRSWLPAGMALRRDICARMLTHENPCTRDVVARYSSIALNLGHYMYSIHLLRSYNNYTVQVKIIMAENKN